MFTRKPIHLLRYIILLSFGVTPFANAECPCNRSQGGMFQNTELTPIAAPAYQVPYSSQMQFDQSAYSYHPMQPGYGQSPYGTVYSQQSMPVYQMQSQVQANPTPPPGTIGQTFKLPSRPVPVDKHPRVGMIDVKIHNAHDVIVHDMNAMRTEDTIDGFKDAKDKDIWHFESKPLYPGLDHIYRIQATFKNPDGTERKAEKYVRLIMGRVVELTF